MQYTDICTTSSDKRCTDYSKIHHQMVMAHFRKKNKFWKCSYTLHRLTFYKQKAFNFDQFDKNAKTVESKIWNLYEQQHVFFSI